MAATTAAVVQTAHAADPGRSLETIEKSLDAVKKQELDLTRMTIEAETDLKKLRRRSIAIAARAREHDLTIQKLQDRLITLETDRKRTKSSLESRRKQLVGLLAALQRIAMHPPVALIALPMEPVDTIRSALLLRRTVPAVEALGRALNEDLNTLAALSEAIAGARDKIGIQHNALNRQQDSLKRMMSRKAALLKQAREAQSEAQNRAARLGREARDLKDLLARLTEQSQRQKRAAAPQKSGLNKRERIAQPRITALTVPSVVASSGMPVSGRLIQRFGEPEKTGKNARGISIQARSGGTVVAPRDGQVVFAGPFRGLGNLLIIEYQAKYHLLLAGLARIDTEVGENVLAGEPVGTMKASQNAGSALYVELRRNGQPINPLPWLTAGKTKVNG
jgi:septal ring factor EnvC (AmiA/AmiB activator)